MAWFRGYGTPGAIAGQQNNDWYLNVLNGAVYELLAGTWTAEGTIQTIPATAVQSTISLQSTINWAQGFLGFAPLAVGTGSEPAITSANMILQTILNPPFKWRWNRATQTFQTSTSTPTQDYAVPVTNFGWLENAYLSGQIELDPKLTLSVDSSVDRPVHIAAQLEASGQVTFRLQPVPPITPQYTVTVNYQQAAPVITSLAGMWAPVPDYLSSAYSWGFLSLMRDYFGDPRAQLTRQIFVATILGLAEGLTEQERSIFASAWLGRDRNEMIEQMTAQLGERGRGI